MLTIKRTDIPEDNSIVLILEDNGIAFKLESESLDAIYGNEGIPFTVSSPSFPDISEHINADPVEMRSMQEVYNRLLSLAQKGEL